MFSLLCRYPYKQIIFKMNMQADRVKGKLGVLIPAHSSLADIFTIGVEATKNGIYQPFLSLTQNGRIPFSENNNDDLVPIRSFVPLSDVHQIVPLKYEVTEFPENKGMTKFDLARSIIYSIEMLSENSDCTRLVMLWSGQKETFNGIKEVHQTLETFEEGLLRNDPDLSLSMIHAYAAILLGIPFINGSANIACEIPSLIQFAEQTNTPFCGRKFKMRIPAIPKLLSNSVYVDTQSMSSSTYHPDTDPALYSDNAILFPIILDTVLFMDLAKRAHMKGGQRWLSFYFSKTKHEHRMIWNEAWIEIKKLQATLLSIREILAPALND